MSEELLIGAIRESLALKQALLEDAALLETVTRAGRAIVSVLERGGKVIFFGNGGSAADAQHLAAELVGRYEFERAALPAIALTVNTSTVTAIGNDHGYETVFARQIEILGSPEDAAVGISTSGKSPNVLAGLRTARNKGLVTLALTGRNSELLQAVTDYCISVPSNRTSRIQEAHILIGHALCEIVERVFVKEDTQGQD